MILRRLFSQDPDESVGILRFARLGALIQAAAIVSLTASDILFLWRVGFQELPWVFLATAGLLSVSVPLLDRLIERFGTMRTLRGALAALAVGGVALFFAVPRVPGGESGIYYAARVYSGIVAIVLYFLFWKVMAACIPEQRRGAAFQILGAGSATGIMLGGALVAAGSLVDVRHLFIAGAGVGLAAFLAAGATGPGSVAHGPSGVDPSPGRFRLREHLREVRGSGLAFPLLLSVLALALVTAIVEYDSFRILSADIGEEELGRSLGRLLFLAGGLAFAVHRFLFGRIEAAFGVGNVALIQPLAFAAAFVFIVHRGGYLAGTVGFLSVHGLLPSVELNNRRSLVGSLPTPLRGLLPALILGVGVPVGLGAAGLTLLLATTFAPSTRVAVIGVTFAMAAFGLALWLAEAHRRSVGKPRPALVSGVLVPLLAVSWLVFGFVAARDIRAIVILGFDRTLEVVSTATAAFIDPDLHRGLRARYIVGLAPGPDGESLWGLDTRDGTLVEIDRDTGEGLLASDAGLSGAIGLAWDATRTRFYTMRPESGAVLALDPHAVGPPEPIGHVPVGGRALAFDPKTDRLVVAGAGGLEAYALDGLGSGAGPVWRLAGGALSAVAIDSEDGRLFAVNKSNDFLTALAGNERFGPPLPLTAPGGRPPEVRALGVVQGRIWGAGTGLFTIDPESGTLDDEGYLSGYRDSESSEYRRYSEPMRRIMDAHDITYLSSQNLPDRESIEYVVDGTRAPDHSPIGTVERLENADEIEGLARVLRDGVVYRAEVEYSEDWALLGSAAAPILEADGTSEAMVQAVASVRSVRDRTRNAVAVTGLLAIAAFLLGLLSTRLFLGNTLATDVGTIAAGIRPTASLLAVVPVFVAFALLSAHTVYSLAEREVHAGLVREALAMAGSIGEMMEPTGFAPPLAGLGEGLSNPESLDRLVERPRAASILVFSPEGQLVRAHPGVSAHEGVADRMWREHGVRALADAFAVSPVERWGPHNRAIAAAMKVPSGEDGALGVVGVVLSADRGDPHLVRLRRRLGLAGLASALLGILAALILPPLFRRVAANLG